VFVDNPFAFTAPFNVTEVLVKLVALFVDTLALIEGI
jgi:hypothetical protein